MEALADIIGRIVASVTSRFGERAQTNINAPLARCMDIGLGEKIPLAHGGVTPGEELGLSPCREETTSGAASPRTDRHRQPGDLLETRAAMGKRSVIATTPNGCTIIGGIGEIAPMAPALGAEKAPRSDVRTGQEQGPDRPFPHAVRLIWLPVFDVSVQRDAVRRSGQTEGEAPWRPGTPRLAQDNPAVGPMLQIAARQQDRAVDPRVIVQGAIIIRTQEVVQIDIEVAVAWNDPPTLQVWRLQATDHDIWLSHRSIRRQSVAIGDYAHNSIGTARTANNRSSLVDARADDGSACTGIDDKRPRHDSGLNDHRIWRHVARTPTCMGFPGDLAVALNILGPGPVSCVIGSHHPISATVTSSSGPIHRSTGASHKGSSRSAPPTV